MIKAEINIERPKGMSDEAYYHQVGRAMFDAVIQAFGGREMTEAGHQGFFFEVTNKKMLHIMGELIEFKVNLFRLLLSIHVAHSDDNNKVGTAQDFLHFIVNSLDSETREYVERLLKGEEMSKVSTQLITEENPLFKKYSKKMDH